MAVARETAIAIAEASAASSQRPQLHKGAIFGPVELVLRTTRYTTVLVDGWWINVIAWYKRDRVWQRGGCVRCAAYRADHFAYVVQRAVVNAWYQRGWMDSVSASRRDFLDAAGDLDEDRRLWI